MMYLVVIESGDYEDYRENPLFVTHDESFASNYVEKFNRVIGKLTSFYFKRAEEYYSCDNGSKDWMGDSVDRYHDHLGGKPIAKYTKIEVR